MQKNRGFTLIELLVVISIIALLIGILLPALGASRRTANQMKNSANLRGVMQSTIIFSQNNNQYFPGLNDKGALLNNVTVNGQTGIYGHNPHKRLFLLLNDQYLGPELLINPIDNLSKWVTGQLPTSANTSYAGLVITNIAAPTTTTNSEGRLAEWKNNTNSQAVLWSDRMLAANPSSTTPAENADATMMSPWSAGLGGWKGNVVWGDGHAEYLQSNLGLQTRYRAFTNTNDNLFTSVSAAGVTETSVDSTSNAAMVYY